MMAIPTSASTARSLKCSKMPKVPGRSATRMTSMLINPPSSITRRAPGKLSVSNRCNGAMKSCSAALALQQRDYLLRCLSRPCASVALTTTCCDACIWIS
ncbi:hypothetical protein D3C84_1070970 [compost metagenome]